MLKYLEKEILTALNWTVPLAESNLITTGIFQSHYLQIGLGCSRLT